MPTPEKIRVLIVDDINETRENIRRMLQFDPVIEVVGTARTGKEAIEMAVQSRPDVVIMDINMPDMDGITATENIRRKVPFTQVVILSVQNDPGYMRRAMLVGARDFLAKPPMIDELTSAIRRAGSVAADERNKAGVILGPSGQPSSTSPFIQMPAQMGKIVTVYSPKGGSGKTTISTNLSIALHKEDAPAAIIDANLQYGDVAVFLNEQGKNTILDLAPRVDELDPEIVRDVMISHSTSGISALLAPPKPEYYDSVTGEQFSKLIHFLQRMFAWVVIDTTSYLTDVVQTALDVSNAIILITTQDIPSIKSCNLFLNLMDKSGISRERILFIMNRYNKQFNIAPKNIGDSLRQPVVHAIAEDDRSVNISINKGIPFMVENRASATSKAVLSLADMVKERISKLEADREAEAAKR
mgnify:CR=1 FL=1